MINKNDKNNETKAGYFFHDLNAKINHKFSDKSRIYLSAYIGKDKAYSKEKSNYENGNEDEDEFYLEWGNITTAFRWNYMISNKLFSNTTLTYSRYKFTIGKESKNVFDGIKSENMFEYSSGIYDFTGKIDFDYFPNPNHSIKFGIADIYHTFNPGVTAVKTNEENISDNINMTLGNKKIYAHELACFI